jgi:hypothetical protein
MPPKGWKMKRKDFEDVDGAREFEPDQSAPKKPRATKEEWKLRKDYWRITMKLTGDKLNYMLIARHMMENPDDTIEQLCEDLQLSYHRIQKYWLLPEFQTEMKAEIERIFENDVKPRAMAYIKNAIMEGKMSVILKVADMAGWYDIIAKDKKEGEKEKAKAKAEAGKGEGSGKVGAGMTGKTVTELKELFEGQGQNIFSVLNRMEKQVQELGDQKREIAKEGRETQKDELEEINAKEEELRLMIDGLAGEMKGKSQSVQKEGEEEVEENAGESIDQAVDAFNKKKEEEGE